MGRSSPLLAATLTIFLLSLIGIPITGGFFAKFYVFSAALRANLVWLTLIGVVNSAIGAYYYLRIIVVMYMRESRKEVPVTPIPFGLATALAVSIFATLYLGLLPQPDSASRPALGAGFAPATLCRCSTQIPQPTPTSVH